MRIVRDFGDLANPSGKVALQVICDRRFAAVEQLREIAGIGEARFGTLRELVRV